MAKNTGGPAFPVAWPTPNVPEPGMTLRDWFAGRALMGMCCNHGTFGPKNGPGAVAERAYEMADAMLAERTKGDQP